MTYECSLQWLRNPKREQEALGSIGSAEWAAIASSATSWRDSVARLSRICNAWEEHTNKETQK